MKSFLVSKTLWFNFLTGIVFIATFFFGYQPDDSVTHTIENVITNPLFIITVNGFLRLITKKEVTLKLPEDVK